MLDLATGKLEFAVLIKGFQFEKALMQEHFNENYLESNKFPKATFKGQIDNYTKIDVTKMENRRSKYPEILRCTALLKIEYRCCGGNKSRKDRCRCHI